ncbi:MAG: Zn-dependent protease [Myxococcota bacterium]
MQIGRVLGIPIFLHWTFLGLLAGLLAWATWVGGVGALLPAALVVGGVAGTVVLHELGHAVAAKRYGIGTAHITLYPFGGIAAIERMPEEPGQELVIALAGPAVNFALFALLSLGGSVTGIELLRLMGMMNLGMGLFNLIPAFPMDGGRVLRAALASRMGFVPASKLAIRIGTVFAWLFLIVGLYTWTPSLVMVGGFLHVALRIERNRLIWTNYRDKTGFTPPWNPDDLWRRRSNSARVSHLFRRA